MKKHIIVLSIALLFGYVYWFSKPMEEQQIEGGEQPLYEIIANMVAERKAKEDTDLEFWLETDIPVESAEYKEIYNKKYQEKYTKLMSMYRGYEENWDTYKKKLDEDKHWVKQLIGGNFNYAMTLDEIKQKIKYKFIARKRRGLIISKDEYEKIKSSYINLPSIDLTRIWGAEWLKGGIEHYNNEDYDVPGYKIVSYNPNNINIILYLGDRRFPMASQLKEGEAFIDTVKIIGPPAGSGPHHLPRKLGYVDLGASPAKAANIRKEISTGKYYIVDTEMKSFQHDELGLLKPYEQPSPDSFACYAYEKFLLNNSRKIKYDKITIKINLEEE